MFILQREALLGIFATLFDEWLKENAELLHKGRFFLASSTPDLLPDLLRAAAIGFFVRGEFMRVAVLGDGTYVPGRDGWVLKKILKNAEAFRGKEVAFRLTDATKEFRCFASSRRFGVRGAERHLAEPALLEEDCQIIEALLQHCTRVDVLIPCTSSPRVFRQVAEILRKRFGNRIRIGLMVETVWAARNLSRFKGSQIFMHGPSDLLAEYAATERRKVDYRKDYTPYVPGMIRDARFGISRCRRVSRVYTIKSLVRTCGFSWREMRIFMPDQLLLSDEDFLEIFRALLIG